MPRDPLRRCPRATIPPLFLAGIDVFMSASAQLTRILMAILLGHVRYLPMV